MKTECFLIFETKRKMAILNSLIVPKYKKGRNFGGFWQFSLLQNIKKNKVGPFEGKHNCEKKSQTAEKIERVAQYRTKLVEKVYG